MSLKIIIDERETGLNTGLYLYDPNNVNQAASTAFSLLDIADNFASFEKSGIDLTDETLVTYDENSVTRKRVGTVSTLTADGNGSTNFRMSFELPDNRISDAQKITINFFRDVVKSFTVRTLKNSGQVQSLSVSSNQQLSTQVSLSGAEFDEVEITCTETAANSFVKIRSVIIGQSYELDETKIEGEVSIYVEGSPAYVDVPSGSVEFTALIEGHTPIEGQTGHIYHNGEFLIDFAMDSVTNDGGDIYRISGVDYLGMLDGYVVAAENTETQFTGKTTDECVQLAMNNSEIPIDNFVSSLANRKAYFPANCTAREGLARCNRSARHNLITLKSQGKITAYEWIDAETAANITEERIFDRYRIEKQPPLKYVEVNCVKYENDEEVVDSTYTETWFAKKGVANGGESFDFSVYSGAAATYTPFIYLMHNEQNIEFSAEYEGWNISDWITVCDNLPAMIYAIDLSLSKNKIIATVKARFKYSA